jgi:hypothetical protein
MYIHIIEFLRLRLKGISPTDVVDLRVGFRLRRATKFLSLAPLLHTIRVPFVVGLRGQPARSPVAVVADGLVVRVQEEDAIARPVAYEMLHLGASEDH